MLAFFPGLSWYLLIQWAQRPQASQWPLYKAYLIRVAAAIVISIQAVGVVLVVALLITPAAAGPDYEAHHPLDAYGAAIGLFSAVTGLYISYYLAAPPELLWW